MKREIGHEFSFLGYVLKVEKATDACGGCSFLEHNLACHHKEIASITGSCGFDLAGDPDVIFTKIM